MPVMFTVEPLVRAYFAAPVKSATVNSPPSLRVPLFKLILPRLLQLGAVALLGAIFKIPPLTPMVPVTSFVKVPGVMPSVPAVTLSDPWLMKVPGLMPNALIVLATMLPLLVMVAALLW